jgi:hypothetical protein
MGFLSSIGKIFQHHDRGGRPTYLRVLPTHHAAGLDSHHGIGSPLHRRSSHSPGTGSQCRSASWESGTAATDMG